tara:strand:- start:3420 stop:4232 length:813 start_codon:yes stop_codon:yes gene_type:complete
MIGVTGATGFIGKHLMNALGDSAIPINMRDDDKDIMNLLMENNIKIIIHLANPTPSINQDDVGKKGIELGERIVDIADSIGEIYFILISSIRVYPNGFETFDKNTPLEPIDEYGRGKVAVENIIKKSKHRVLGLRVSSVMGIDLDGTPRGLIGTFVNQSMKYGELKVMGDGSAKKDLIHVSDLIQLLLILVEQKSPKSDLFLPVGGGKSWTVLEIANYISKETNSEISFIEPAIYELSNSVNINDICELSGWSPIWTIENMILESVGGLE